jgi:glycogen(starch) synthase
VRVLAVGNMYPPHHLGGYEQVWEIGMALLRDRGDDVAVLTTDFELPDPKPRADPGFPVWRELRWYWRDHRFPRLSLRERLAVESHNARAIGRALGEVRPDAVAWWPMGGMSLSLLEQVAAAGVPSVAAVCDDWFTYAPQVDAWTRMWGRRPRLARAAAAVTRLPTLPSPARAIDSWVFLSEHLAAKAREHGVRPRAARVAYRGPDRLFRAAGGGERPPWRWRLLYVGRIDERKGIDLAVEALRFLPEEATLVVEGGGDEDELARLRELAPAGRVSFSSSPRAELPGLVAGADVVLFPVRWAEPWGLVPLESMAAGTPVVASGRGGSGEYLRHEENCLVADPDDGPETLAAAVRRLAGDPALRERLGRGGRETADSLDPLGFETAVAEELDRVGAKSQA